MRFISLIVIAGLILAGCTNNSSPASILTTDSLPLQEYAIRIDRDTVLKTANGALLAIPKGSLEAKGNTATLEIREAYSMSQILKAGLSTMSPDGPLSSGGMIYINAKAGQSVKITKAIRVALPSDYLQKDMQLYKGKADANGPITWDDPKPLPPNPQLAGQQLGQSLFQARCASCHDIGRDKTGPDLAHFVKRFGLLGENNWQYYEHFFRNTFEGHFSAPIIYKCNLRNRYGSTGPHMIINADADSSIDRKELDDIYRYIQSESDRRQLPLPPHAYLKDCADSCMLYKEGMRELKERQEEARLQRRTAMTTNGSRVDRVYKDVDTNNPVSQPVTQLTVPPSPPPVDFSNTVSPENFSANYYQFTIESFGWYNIDILLKKGDGIEESRFWVRFTGTYRKSIQVYMIIPSKKVLLTGGPADKTDTWAFFKKDGTVFLPQGAKAWILAFTETDDKIAYALQSVILTKEQELELNLQEGTRESFNRTMVTMGLDNMKISVDESKNAATIRQLDKELKNVDSAMQKIEQLRPRNCDCDCYNLASPTATESEITRKK